MPHPVCATCFYNLQWIKMFVCIYGVLLDYNELPQFGRLLRSNFVTQFVAHIFMHCTIITCSNSFFLSMSTNMVNKDYHSRPWSAGRSADLTMLRIWLRKPVCSESAHVRSGRESHASVDRGQHRVTWYWNGAPSTAAFCDSCRQTMLRSMAVGSSSSNTSSVCAQSKYEG